MSWDFRSLHLISCSVHKFPVCLWTNCLTHLFFSSPLELGITVFLYFVGTSVRVNIVRLRSLTSNNCWGSWKDSCSQLCTCSCPYQAGQHLRSCIFGAVAVSVFRLNTELTVIWVDSLFPICKAQVQPVNVCIIAICRSYWQHRRLESGNFYLKKNLPSLKSVGLSDVVASAKTNKKHPRPGQALVRYLFWGHILNTTVWQATKDCKLIITHTQHRSLDAFFVLSENDSTGNSQMVGVWKPWTILGLYMCTFHAGSTSL